VTAGKLGYLILGVFTDSHQYVNTSTFWSVNESALSTTFREGEGNEGKSIMMELIEEK